MQLLDRLANEYIQQQQEETNLTNNLLQINHMISDTDERSEESSNDQDVDDRRLKPMRPSSPNAHERLLKEIRSRPKLRPIRGGRLVLTTSRSRLNSDNDVEPTVPAKRVIKPDFNLFDNNSFEESSEEDDHRRLSSLTSSSVSDLSRVSRIPGSSDSYKAEDVLMQENEGHLPERLQRRHTIMACEFPLDRKKRGQNSIEFLSLTLEEVAHIRSVLTKAELESLATHPELYRQVLKGKLCFTCKATKFTLFGEWGTKCRFCQRSVCSKCIRKVHVPIDHLRNIPVYTLNQSSMTAQVQEYVHKIIRTAPPPSMPQTRAPSPNRNQSEIYQQWKQQEHFSLQQGSIKVDSKSIRNTFTRSKPNIRSQSLFNTGQKQKSGTPKSIQRPMMVICCDCKEMVTEIIRASRASLTLISSSNSSNTNSTYNFSHLPDMSVYINQK